MRRARLGFGSAVFWPFLVRVGVVRAQLGVLAFSLPFLAVAYHLCVWVPVLALSRLFWVVCAVCAFGWGLRGRLCVCQGTGVTSAPPFLVGAWERVWDVSGPFLAGFVVCVCGLGYQFYPAIFGLGLWLVVRYGFCLKLACRAKWGLSVCVSRPSWLGYVATLCRVGGLSPVVAD